MNSNRIRNPNRGPNTKTNDFTESLLSAHNSDLNHSTENTNNNSGNSGKVEKDEEAD